MVRRLDLLTQRLSREQLNKPEFWFQNILELDTVGDRYRLRRQSSNQIVRDANQSTAAKDTAAPHILASFSTARVLRAQRSTASDITSHMSQSVRYLNPDQLLTLSLNTALLNVSLDLKKEIPHPIEFLPHFNSQTAEVVYQELITLLRNYRDYAPYPLVAGNQTNIADYTHALMTKLNEDSISAILYYKEVQTIVHLLIGCYKNKHLQLGDKNEIIATNQTVDRIASLLKRIRPKISQDMDNFFYHETNAAIFEQDLRKNKYPPIPNEQSDLLPKPINLDNFLYPNVHLRITTEKERQEAGMLAEECRNILNQCRSSAMLIIKQIHSFLETLPYWKEVILRESEQVMASNSRNHHPLQSDYDSDTDSDPELEVFLEQVSVRD